MLLLLLFLLLPFCNTQNQVPNDGANTFVSEINKFKKMTFLRTLLVVILTGTFTNLMAQNGAIKGVVLDEQNLSMPGANIVLVSINKGTVSNAKGQFELLNVPEGSYELQVTYMGFETKTETVVVESNTTSKVKMNLTAATMVGDEVLIMGDRLKGQAKALNDQKNRSNISNIVASDQIGRFPDANIGDALKRVPGITMQNDQGEARDIIIRGMAPQLNSVTLNGERVPSAEGDNRRVQLDLIPSDMIQMIEVSKVVTPDMDADAIGGSVNLVTRSEASNKRISGTLGSGYNFLSEKPIWTGALILSDRFAKDKLGAILSMSYNNHNFGSDNIEAEWIDHETQGLLADEFQLRTYKVQRIRRSISLGLDYQLNTNNTITLSGMYNWRDDWENRYRFVAKDIGDAADDGNITKISDGLFNVAATAERQTKGGIGNDRIDNKRLEDQRTANVSLRGDHLIKNKIKINWSGTYAKASEERKNERYLQYTSEGIPMHLDITDTRRPNAFTTNENQWSDMELDELTEENQYTFEKDINGKLDVQFPINENGIIKVGGLYRSKNKERENDYAEYSLTNVPHPVFGNETLGEVPVSDQTNPDFLMGSQYRAGHFADKNFLGGLDLKNNSLYEKEDQPGEYVPGNYKAEEDITAAYIMTDYQLSPKLSTVVGVRMENTSVHYKGFSYDLDSDAIGTTEGSNHYTNVLPNLQFKFNARENTILRLAYSNTIARPGYYQLVPFEAYSQEDGELEIGNPELQPTSSMNIDFMGEHYFKNVGLFSVGYFYKDVEDFIYEQEIDDYNHPVYGTVDLKTFNNGQKASVSGIEAGFQKQFKGIGLYLNYTYTDTKIDGIVGRESETLQLPGSAKHMYNASLSYETKALVLRVSLNHASDYLDELGGEAFEDRYYDKQTFIDVNGSYAFTKNWRLFAEVNNITNQALRYYQGSENLTMQEEQYNMRFNLGLKFDLFGE